MDEIKRELEQNSLQNSFYALEDRRKNVKDSFKLIAEKISFKLNEFNSEKISLCDVGCASGDFLFYLQNRFEDKNLKLFGTDVDLNLLEIAKSRMPSIDFFERNIAESDVKNNCTYDIVTFSGVLSLFADFKPIFENLIKSISRGGGIVCFPVVQSVRL